MRYLIFLVLFSLPVQAGLISFKLKGTLSGYVTESGAQRSIYDSYSGMLSFDTENISSYIYNNGKGHQTGSYQLGDLSYFSVQTSTDIFESYLNDISAFVVDNGPAEGDRISYHSDNTKFNGVVPQLSDPLSMGLIFGDYSKQALNSSSLPYEVDLNNFDASFFLYGGGSAMSPAEFSVQGSITSFETVLIPEPFSFLLFALTLIGLFFSRSLTTAKDK